MPIITNVKEAHRVLTYRPGTKLRGGLQHCCWPSLIPADLDRVCENTARQGPSAAQQQPHHPRHHCSVLACGVYAVRSAWPLQAAPSAVQQMTC